MSTATSASNVSLRPAQDSDIPALIAISGASFQNDTHTHLKGLAQTPPVTAAEYMTQGADAFFLSRLNNPGTSLTAATLPNSPGGDEAIVGFLIAGSRGIPNHNPAYQPAYQDLIHNRGAPPTTPPDPSTASGTIQDLATITDKSMHDWMAWFLTPPPGATEPSCYFIISMSIHPDHQSQGVGSALMRELGRKCDEAGVACWVQSSDSAARFYERHGFVEVGRLEVDLERFNVTGEGRRVEKVDGGGRWGWYCWRYMERAPRR